MNSRLLDDPQFPCPCCGYIVFHERPPADEICPICSWQEDAVSLLDMTIEAGGPNDVSLVQAQKNFAAFGASEERLKKHVRSPLPSDRRDPEWRMIDEQIDERDAIPVDELPNPWWYEDSTRLYYWRSSYLRKKPSSR